MRQGMGKRLLSLCLTLVMALGLLPAVTPPALAATSGKAVSVAIKLKSKENMATALQSPVTYECYSGRANAAITGPVSNQKTFADSVKQISGILNVPVYDTDENYTYPFSLTVTLKDNCKLDGARLCNKGVSSATWDENKVCDITPVLQDNGSYKLTYTLTKELLENITLGSAVTIILDATAPKSYPVNFYPKPDEKYTKMSQQVPEGTVVTDPGETSYTGTTSGKVKQFFSIMELKAGEWYTAPPVFNSETGEYTADPSKKWDFAAPVTADVLNTSGELDLYGLPTLRENAAVRVEYEIPVREKTTAAENGSPAGSDASQARYDPTTKRIVAEGASYPVLTIPVEKPIGSDAIPGVGKYGTDDSAAVIVDGWLPSRGMKLTRWLVDSTELTADYKLSQAKALELAERSFSNDIIVLTIRGEAVINGTVSFHSGIEGENISPFEFTNTDSGVVRNRVAVSAEKTAELAEWVKQQEAAAPRMFKGWYLDQAYKGNPVDLQTPLFYSDADLYAKWVRRYTLHYDTGGYTLTNGELFQDTPIGEGDKLTEPEERPVSEGVVFRGWYKDASFTTPWNFAEDTVTRDVTLYAKFEPSPQITVVFRYYEPDDMGNESPKQAQRIEHVPVAAGYVFGKLPDLPGGTSHTVSGARRDLTYTKWEFLNKNGISEELTPATVLQSNLADDAAELIVAAKADISFRFTFDLQGGSFNSSDASLGAPQTAKGESGKAEKPGLDPIKAGQEFDGWCADKEGNTLFDFEKEYRENTTVYAKWRGETVFTVHFDIPSSQAQTALTLTKDDETIEPASKTDARVTYSLHRGAYRYTASAPGYKAVTAGLTVDEAGGLERTITVELPSFVSVTGVTLSELEILQGKSCDLNALASVTPENAAVKTIEWSVKTGTSLPDGVTLTGSTLAVAKSAAAGGSIQLTAVIRNGRLGADGSTEEDFTQDVTLTVAAFRPTVTFASGTSGPQADGIQGLPAPVVAGADGRIAAPAQSPTANGWTFTRWYTDAACQTEWKATDPFTEDATLYAGWEKITKEVTVTFAGGEGAAANSGAALTIEGSAGDKITLPACMFTRSGYVFRAWKPGTAANIFAGAEYTLPNEDITLTAQWTAVRTNQTADDVTHALDGITESNAADHKPQIDAAVEALGGVEEPSQSLIKTVEGLYEKANPGASAVITGGASTGAVQTGAVLSSDGTKRVELKIDTVATPSKSLPSGYQDYTAACREIKLLVDGAEQSRPKVPVTITLPIPAELADMAKDTIRVLHYKGTSAIPTVLVPVIPRNGSTLTFTMDSFSHVYLVGKAVSDDADVSVDSLVMKYNGTEMGKVTKDEQGNFTVTLSSTTSESIIGDLGSGINSKWITCITAAEGCKIKEKGSGGIAEQTASYWRDTGVCVTYALDSKNNYTASRTFTVTARDGKTTGEFTVTVKKITDADRKYTIATENIVGGTVTASPNPAAANEAVKLTITPADGKKLAAGSLSWCLQSAGAEKNAIDETTLTFNMPEGDVNINAQFTDDDTTSGAKAPQITSFVIGNASGVINNESRVITVILPYGTDLGNVAPIITGQNIRKIEPASAARIDLRSPKTYTVYGTDGSSVSYTVSAYTEDPSPAVRLCEKLQEQINENGSWWEQAERQKVRGTYGTPKSQRPLSSLGGYVDDIDGQNGNRRVSISHYISGNYVVLEPSARTLSGSSWKNFIELPRYTLTDLERLGYDGVIYDLGELNIQIPTSMETARGFKITVCEASSSIRQKWNRVSDRLDLYAIEASSTRRGLTLSFEAGGRGKSELRLMKYEPTKGSFVEVERDRWTVTNGFLVTDPMSAGVYGLARR